MYVIALKNTGYSVSNLATIELTDSVKGVKDIGTAITFNRKKDANIVAPKLGGEYTVSKPIR